ncbi:hypothetical protein LAZ67_23001250 [Cordylochernes scorpioides]|uniref:Uncharacterized protein n=1 Tax=Cordylochernes scorpioides TaxID=51811 RepID=A0ABY6LQK4_9ARAC|nr:hypothetical protein LAZ67_23001250 [Cordylochernes scorpioides]
MSGIRHTKTSLFNPSTNGLVERTSGIAPITEPEEFGDEYFQDSGSELDDSLIDKDFVLDEYDSDATEIYLEEDVAPAKKITSEDGEWTEDNEVVEKAPPFFAFGVCENAKRFANVAPPESPGGALQMPERLGSNRGALAENSAKEALAIDSSEINEKTAGYENLPASNNHENPAAARDVTAPMSSTCANQALRSWAETMEGEDGPEDDFTIVRNKKRRRGSAPSEHPAAQPSSARGPDNSQPRKRPTGLRTRQLQEVKATRTNISLMLEQGRLHPTRTTMSSSSTVLTLHPTLQSVDKLVRGPKNIVQFNRMNGHVLVDLSSKALADQFIDQGLEIEGTTLKIFPYRKRAKRIIVANLPGFVEDAAIIETLRSYGLVTSIAHIQVKMDWKVVGGYDQTRKPTKLLLIRGNEEV